MTGSRAVPQAPSYREGSHKTGVVLHRFRTRFVNGDPTSVYLGLVELSNCLSGLGSGCHLDERTAWLPHAVVGYDLDRLDRADRGEELPDLGFIRRDGNVANVELSTHQYAPGLAVRDNVISPARSAAGWGIQL